MTDAGFLLQVLADGKPRSTMQIIEASMRERGCGLTPHSRAAELRERGHTIHCIRQPGATVRDKPTYFYRLDARRAESAALPAEESGGALATGGPPGRVPQTVAFPERQVASASALSPSPSTTQATGLPVGEPETRPTLFDLPAAPAWS